MSLSFPRAAELRDILRGEFPIAGPFLGRDLSIDTTKLRLSGTGGAGAFGIGPGLPPGGVAPRASYQWLLFETIDGGSPSGAQEFIFEGETIPFVGAITEVDVIAEEKLDDWQMRIEVSGLGPIFRTSQSAEIFIDQGWFRPTPPGFWPETEGLVFPLPSPGSRPVIRFRRTEDNLKNLTIRVLIVAHPSL